MTITWRALALTAALTLAACGEQAQFNNKCDRITSERCNREAVCDGATDFGICAANHESSWECDPDASLEQMDECIRQLDPEVTPCGPTLMPEICYEVLCSTLMDCDFVTENGTEPTGSTTYPYE